MMKIMKGERSSYHCFGMTFFLQMITSCCYTFTSHWYFKGIGTNNYIYTQIKISTKRYYFRKQILWPFIVQNMSKFRNRTNIYCFWLLSFVADFYENPVSSFWTLESKYDIRNTCIINQKSKDDILYLNWPIKFYICIFYHCDTKPS